MKNLLNSLKATDLKEVAKQREIKTTGLKKAELVELLSNKLFAKGGSFVTFNRNESTGVISNSNVIADGSLIAYPTMYDLDKGKVLAEHLNGTHKRVLIKAIKEDTVADINMDLFKISEYANVLVIKTLADYRMAKALFGVASNEITVDGLQTVQFLNYENASKLIDGIFFTKEIVAELKNADSVDALQGLTSATLFMFNGKVSRLTTVTNSEKLIKDTHREMTEVLPTKVKKTQYKILKANISDLVLDMENQRYVLPKDKGVYVDMSENRVFRKYGKTLIDSAKNKYLAVPEFMVFEAVPSGINALSSKERKTEEQRTGLILDYIIPNGFFNEHTDEYVCAVAQSASQARKGNYYFSSYNVEELQSELIYGYDFGTKFVMANKQARAGLAFTSATLVSLKPRVKVIEDPSEVVNTKTVFPTGVDKERGIAKSADESGNILIASRIEEKEFTPNDGAGLIEVLPAMSIAKDLGLISVRDYNFFKENYTSMGDLTATNIVANEGLEVATTESKLLKIFNSIPKGYQIRYGGDKGLLVVFPFTEYRDDLADFDIIEGSNMRKYTLQDYSNVTFEIASHSHHATEEAPMNYQFLQSLDITAEQLCELAERKLTALDKDILVNPTSALKFLGIYEKFSDTEEETGLTTKFAKVITANPNMLHDTYIQQSIKRLLVKYIYMMGFGTVPVKGSYHYVISDPFHFLGEGKENVQGLTELSMQVGENYLNDKACTVACFRAPMVHKSEVQKIELVKNELLWFIQDIIVLNPYELTLPGAGGADTDGDKFAVVEEEIIVNSVCKCDYIPFDDGIKAKPAVYQSEEEVLNALKVYFRATSKPSQIGLITNYATNFRDLELHSKVDYNNTILGLRFTQGWEIDRAKTGAVVEIPEVYSSVKLVPHWKHFLNEFHKDQGMFQFEADRYFTPNATTGEYDYMNHLRNENEIYCSSSPIGQLFNYVYLRAKQILAPNTNANPLNNFTGALVTVVNPETVLAVEPAIRELESNYRKELIEIVSVTSNKDDKDKRSQSLEALSTKYSNLVKSLSDDYLALAVACYRVAYNRANNETSSRSFPWTVMFDELLEVIQSLNNSVKLVKLPKVEEEIQSIKVSNANMLFINGSSYGIVAIDPGVYTHTEIGGANYTLVKRTKAVQTYVRKEVENKVFQVTLRGFAKQGLNALEVVDILSKSNFSAQLINDVPSVVVDGKVISGIASDDTLKVVGIYNKSLSMVEHLDPRFIPKRITADIHWFNQAENIAIAKSLTITCKVVGDLGDDEVFKAVTTTQQVVEEVTSDTESIACYSDYEPDYSYMEETYVDPYNGLNPTVVESVHASFDNIWDVISLDAPVGASKVELQPVAFDMNDGVKANVVLYAGNNAYTYSVIKTGRQLSVATNLPSVKDTTASFLKRLVAYNLISSLIIA